MFKKFSNKQLTITLVVLGVLYLASLAFSGGSDSSFQKNLALIDTATVKSIVIEPAKVEGTVSIIRAANGWQVTRPDGQVFEADAAGVTQALDGVSALEALQIIANDESQWTEYKVDEENGTRVKVSTGDKTPLDLIVGRFEYKQSGLMSYVRLSGEDEVYLVKGFLDATFNKEANDWRNKRMITGTDADWLSFNFTYPDSSFQMFKGVDNQWRLADSTQLDGGKVNGFLGTFSNLTGTTFVENAPGGAPAMRIEATRLNQEPVTLSAFPVDTTFVLSSSQNPGAYFSGEGFYDRVFKGLGHFMPVVAAQPE